MKFNGIKKTLNAIQRKGASGLLAWTARVNNLIRLQDSPICFPLSPVLPSPYSTITML